MESKELSLPVPSTIVSIASSLTNGMEEEVRNSDPNLVSSYFKTFPRGFKFHPTDEDLVFYLSKKLKNEALPPNLIVELDLYQYNPEYLAATYMDYGEKQWYFFTPRERKYRNGSRPNRSAADGYWKATGADKLVEEKGVLVGYRKALVFYKGNPKGGNKTNWIMHEFTVHDSSQRKRNLNDMRLDDWVLCRIYKKLGKSSKTKSRETSSEHEDEDKHVVAECTGDKHVEVETTATFVDASNLHFDESGIDHANHSAKRQRGTDCVNQSVTNYVEQEPVFSKLPSQDMIENLVSSDLHLNKDDWNKREILEKSMSPQLDPKHSNKIATDGQRETDYVKSVTNYVVREPVSSDLPYQDIIGNLFSSDPRLLKDDRIVRENSENNMSPQLDPIPTSNNANDGQRGTDYVKSVTNYGVREPVFLDLPHQDIIENLLSSDPRLLEDDRFVKENSENNMSPQLDPIPTNNNANDGQELPWDDAYLSKQSFWELHDIIFSK